MDQVDQVARITSQSYLEGEASLLDYLDALRVQLDTSMDYYELLHQVNRARVALEMAVGGTSIDQNNEPENALLLSSFTYGDQLRLQHGGIRGSSSRHDRGDTYP